MALKSFGNCWVLLVITHYDKSYVNKKIETHILGSIAKSTNRQKKRP